MKRILIIRPGAIGDVLLTTPFIRALKTAFPQAEIDYLVAPFASQVLRKNPYINEIILLEKNRLKKGSSFVKMIDSLKFYNKLRAKKYDAVFDLFCNLRTAILALLTGAKTRVGFRFRGRSFFYSIKVKPRKEPQYNTRYHAQLLEPLNIRLDSDNLDLYLTPEDEKKADEFFGSLKKQGMNGPYIGINPAGTWPTKKWPPGHFGRLCGLMSEKFPSAVFVVLWGPGEKELAESVIKAAPEKASVIAAPETGLMESAALIKRFSVLVTNDGGPKHMAAALKVRTVTLYGPTNPVSWEPPSDPLHVHIAAKTGCAPCDKTGCPDRGTECMKSITAEEAAAMAIKLLKDKVEP